MLLIFAGSVYGQKKFKGKRQTSASLIQQAREVMEKSPPEAIRLVEKAINIASKKEKRQVEGEAYVLLGNIYEQIGQNELALQRYQQAMSRVGNKKDSNPKAIIYERMGQLFLTLENDKQAENSFQLCIDLSYDKSLTLKCEEGLTDVKLFQKNNEEVVAVLDSIASKYELDSIEIARLEARKSQAYTQQKDFSKANEYYNNSINVLPKNKEISKEDYKSIKKAKDDLLDSEELSISEELVIRENVATNTGYTYSNDAQVSENLKLAEIFEAENNLPEAERYIGVSKDLITPGTDAAISAEVYKKSSELNQRAGKISAALSDVEKYKVAKEKSILELENDLKQQIEIVKGQKQIDVSQKDYDLNEKDQELMESQLHTQKIIIGLLSLVLIGSLIFFYFLYKNVREKRKANQKLLLKSLRTQMNPHFIFNALNSVNNFIAKNDEKAANKFLADFSRLMRKVLDYSQKDFITFEEEIELNELYLKLEHFRFRDKFNYTFENNAKQYGYSQEVPPMLVQPFIENAVWHGLRYKEGEGHLDVSINEASDHLSIIIKDDGIGRKKSKALKTDNQKKYKSTGLENVSKRIALINDLYDKNYEIKVSDLNSTIEDTGTIVEIKIPII